MSNHHDLRDAGITTKPGELSMATMGTVAVVRWQPDSLDLAGDIAVALSGMHRRYTRFDPASEVSRLGGEWVKLSPDTVEVLTRAGRMVGETDGLFSPFLGHEVRRWSEEGKDSSHVDRLEGGIRVETNGDLARLVRLTDGATERSPAQVEKVPPGTVDLGGVAKGYAADAIRDLVMKAGAESVLVSLGTSSISVGGCLATVALSSPWVGIENLGTIRVGERGMTSLSASADPGTPVGATHHRSRTLHPFTGVPAVTDLQAVIVVGPDGVTCEAHSTAFLVEGLERAMVRDQRRPELATILMTTDGRVFADPRVRMRMMPGVQDWLKTQRE